MISKADSQEDNNSPIAPIKDACCLSSPHDCLYTHDCNRQDDWLSCLAGFSAP